MKDINVPFDSKDQSGVATIITLITVISLKVLSIVMIPSKQKNNIVMIKYMTETSKQTITTCRTGQSGQASFFFLKMIYLVTELAR